MDTARIMYAEAPGKLYLAGEYAVLRGAPAVVAAVAPWGRYVGLVAPRQVAPVFPGASTVAKGSDGTVDTSTFFVRHRKLGFGSSACAAVLHAIAAGQAVDAPSLWLSAYRWHEQLVGTGGSGGDLAAVIHGGVGIFHRRGETPEEGYDWHPVSWPADLHLLAVQSGKSADTRSWSRRFVAAAESDPAVADWVDANVRAVRGFGEPGRTETAFAEAATCYKKLTQWLGPELIPQEFQQAGQIAAEYGLAFKPSGAGGGDLGVFLVSDADQLRSIRLACHAEGLATRLLRPTTTGARWRSNQLSILDDSKYVLDRESQEAEGLAA